MCAVRLSLRLLPIQVEADRQVRDVEGKDRRSDPRTQRAGVSKDLHARGPPSSRRGR